MNTNTTFGSRDISHSDNSHIFGVPFQILEGYDMYGLQIPRKDLCEWIEKTSFLEHAGIEVHLSFLKETGMI